MSGEPIPCLLHQAKLFDFKERVIDLVFCKERSCTFPTSHKQTTCLFRSLRVGVQIRAKLEVGMQAPLAYAQT